MKSSRRSFLKSGAALICSACGLSGGIARSRTLSRYPKSDLEHRIDNGMINWRLEFPPGDARRYGVIGDGKFDNHAPISFGLIAMRSFGGGAVTLPTGNFRIGKPLRMQSNVELRGSGPSTRLLCDRSSESGIGGGLVVLFGSMDAAAFTEASYVELADSEPSQNSVRMLNPADSSRFEAGTLIWIWSPNGYRDSSGLLKPKYQQINKILAIHRESGDVQLESPLYAPVASGFRMSRPSDARSRVFTGPFMTEHSSLSNLSVSPFGKSNEAWTRFGGAYKARIENIVIENSNSIFSANGFAYSVIRGISGTFGRKIMDTAYFCHNNFFDNFDITAAPNSNQFGWGIRFAEGAHHNVVQNMRANVANICRSGSILAFGQGSHDNSIINAHIVGEAAKALVTGHNTASPNMEHHRNIIRKCQIRFSKAKDIISYNSGNLNQVTGITVTESSFEVSRLSGYLISIKGSVTEIVNCNFRTDRGSIKIAKNSDSSIIQGNSFNIVPDIIASNASKNRIISGNSLPNAN